MTPSDEHAPELALGRAPSTANRDEHGGCQACGSPSFRVWHLAGESIRLCPPCATLDGIGCP